MPLLLFNPMDEEGLRASMTLEAMTNGKGHFYQVPGLMFVHFDKKWQSAVKQAKGHFEILGSWRLIMISDIGSRCQVMWNGRPSSRLKEIRGMGH
jgi:hypothetical protein